MALSFIWKKQLVWFITLLLVIVLGLTIGALLHDTFQENEISDVENMEGKAPGVKVAIPSLPYPTTKPGVNGPAGNPPTAAVGTTSGR